MKYHMFNTLERKCEANKVCILRDEKGKGVILFWVCVLRYVLESLVRGCYLQYKSRLTIMGKS